MNTVSFDGFQLAYKAKGDKNYVLVIEIKRLIILTPTTDCGT